MPNPYQYNIPPQGMQVPNSPLMPPTAPQAGGAQNPYGLDPAVLEALLSTYGDTLSLEGMEGQLSKAEALRGLATPEGRDSGRVYTAASPLEHLGTGIQRYRGAKKAKTLEEEMAETRRKIGEQVATYGKNVPR